MIEIEDYPYTGAHLQNRLKKLLSVPLRDMSAQEAYRFLLNSIDLTTLEGADNSDTIKALCDKALSYRDDKRKVLTPAAVCLYPPFVAQAKEALKGSSVKVATVAGAFPAGQSPIEIKLMEVKYAVQQGTDEVDMVISRGKFLEGKYQEVYDEICAIREVCKNVTLKVILETGELKTPQNIYRASQIAIIAGADFIKTSTGKVSVNATPEAFLVMLDAIRAYWQKTGRKVGIKAAGGISDCDNAMQYLRIFEQMVGKEWLSNSYFRIGASRLANKVFEKIQ